SVTHRPPIRSDASKIAILRPAAVSLRAAAMQAAPAPTITTSTSAGAAATRMLGAANAAADAARKERRLNRFMVSERLAESRYIAENNGTSQTLWLTIPQPITEPMNR